ncbi:hypothetical protein [Aquimarina mytili]|uniref:Uncharacterized protein n=1 Tax=Aquimarina mytili TaxID=874423 RepID=A0A936ZTP4_9FLAO|nr:hypothetical protein [Aquimarina mytili]MBL0685379.1 hypothetical protein [Aquimarina mytili]
MEHAITQKKEVALADFEKNRKRWCKEDVLKLTQHFHCFNKTTAQYDRLVHFEMLDVVGFNEIRKKIQTIKIYLAVEKKNKNKITCCPYLLVNDDTAFKLSPIAEEYPRFGDSPVPKIFKEMVWKNWYDAEIHLIDDLFHCWGKKDQSDPESIVRVEYFEFDDIAQTIKDSEEDIQAITLYPGIDMNKFGNKEMISFTPVLGIKPRLFDSGFGRVRLTELNNDETYAEYSSPCPPTCSL